MRNLYHFFIRCIHPLSALDRIPFAFLGLFQRPHGAVQRMSVVPSEFGICAL